MKSIIVLSQSELKKNAVQNIFPHYEYDITFVNVPDNPNRESQPLFENGTKTACNQRISEFLATNPTILENTFILSIENGISIFDISVEEIMLRKLADCDWSDICFCGLLAPNGTKTFFLSPVIIEIDRKYSGPFFLYHYHNQHSDCDTLGKYIAKHGKTKTHPKIPHNNWMKIIAGIDRVEQIKFGLEKVKKFIDSYSL